MISGEWPAEDATVLRYGLRRLLLSLPVMVVFLAAGGTGLWFAFRDDGIGAGCTPLAILLAMGLGGLIQLVFRWRARHWVTAFDSTGFWWMRGKETALIRWDSLAGVGIYEAPLLRTLELCPKAEIDRDDPLLWAWVRDHDPLRPGLPRPRHRVPIRPAAARHAVAAGCRQWAPRLWFGGERMPLGYDGESDRKGHRSRGGGAGGPVGSHDPRHPHGLDGPDVTPAP
ncbi:hypothetical protein [Streptomyces sp. NPDC088358]|uniref:hypothetical protein n=1 Tax=Streptomyces sp. NPDC088358 TaxID=3365857 RepID=UPI0038042C00